MTTPEDEPEAALVLDREAREADTVIRCMWCFNRIGLATAWDLPDIGRCCRSCVETVWPTGTLVPGGPCARSRRKTRD